MRSDRRSTAALALAAVVAMALGGCATAPPRGAEEETMEYLDTLRGLEAEGGTVAPGSAEERAAIERFTALLSDFKAPDFRERIQAVYADDVWFNDTLKTVRGAAAVEEYLAASAANVERGTVEFLDHVRADGNHYFRWVMTLEFQRFARGEQTRSIGMTHVRFDGDGKVVLHQDFWDSAGGLFEHVPVIGWVLQRAKKRL